MGFSYRPDNPEVEKARRILGHRKQYPNDIRKNDKFEDLGKPTAELMPEFVIARYELECWRRESELSDIIIS